MIRIYIIIGALTALAAAWGLSINQAYKRGHAAAVAAQQAANAEAFQEIIKEYNDATSNPITDDVADCILRRLTGDATGEDCGSL